MLPKMIVSNGDSKFSNAFWMHFFRKVGLKLRFWMAIHSQTVGIIELVNGV